MSELARARDGPRDSDADLTAKIQRLQTENAQLRVEAAREDKKGIPSSADGDVTDVADVAALNAEIDALKAELASHKSDTLAQVHEAAASLKASGTMPSAWVIEEAVALQEVVGQLMASLPAFAEQAADSENLLGAFVEEAKRAGIDEEFLQDPNLSWGATCISMRKRAEDAKARALEMTTRADAETRHYAVVSKVGITSILPVLAQQTKRYDDAHAALFKAEAAVVPRLTAALSSTAELCAKDATECKQAISGCAHAPTELAYLVILYQEAIKCMEHLFKWGDVVVGIAKEKGTVIKIHPGPLKGIERALRKAKLDYQGDYSKLLDLVRLSFVCETIESVAACVEAILASLARDDLKAMGLKLRRFKERLSSAYDASLAGGYRDLMLGVEVNGHVAEVQIHVAAFIQIKGGGGHKTYRAGRALGAFESHIYEHNGKVDEGILTSISRGLVCFVRGAGSPLPDGLRDSFPKLRAYLTPPVVRLRELDLSQCGLVGNLPELLTPEVCQQLTGLRKLALGRNRLTGNIPPCIGMLVKLEYLDLHGSVFEHAQADSAHASHANMKGIGGPLPDSMANMVELNTIALAASLLSGPMPTWIGELRQLERVYLCHTNLQGPVPPEFAKLNKLEAFVVDRTWEDSCPQEILQTGKFQFSPTLKDFLQ